MQKQITETLNECCENLSKLTDFFKNSATFQSETVTVHSVNDEPCEIIKKVYNGRINISVTKSLHKRAVHAARKEGVSMSRLLGAYIAEKLAESGY